LERRRSLANRLGQKSNMTSEWSGTREEERGEITTENSGSRESFSVGQNRMYGTRLENLLKGASVAAPVSANAMEILDVACDSRRLRPQSLFFALHGAKADGNAFLKDAIANGAMAIASEDAAPAWLPANIAWVRVSEARKALAIVAANFYGHPAEALQLAAVTGTNGKTTTTSLIDAMVKASGAKTGLFGTIAYHTPRGEYPSPNTTPESVDLQRFATKAGSSRCSKRVRMR